MSPLLRAALEESRSLCTARRWTAPSEATVAEAQRLLELVQNGWREPSVQAEPDGAISLEWEAGAHGWLRLTVAGTGRVEHAAVIEGDEYAQAEDFADALPPWVQRLLTRLLSLGH